MMGLREIQELGIRLRAQARFIIIGSESKVEMMRHCAMLQEVSTV